MSPAGEAAAARVLIVDDEPVNLQVLHNYLTTRGLEVTTHVRLSLPPESGAWHHLNPGITGLTTPIRLATDPCQGHNTRKAWIRPVDTPARPCPALCLEQRTTLKTHLF